MLHRGIALALTLLLASCVGSRYVGVALENNAEQRAITEGLAHGFKRLADKIQDPAQRFEVLSSVDSELRDFTDLSRAQDGLLRAIGAPDPDSYVDVLDRVMTRRGAAEGR